MKNQLNELLTLLSQKFTEARYPCFMQVLNNSFIQSHDESHLEVLCISFRDVNATFSAIDAADALAAHSIEYLKEAINQELRPFEQSVYITKRGSQTLITGYQYSEQASHFASVLLTDCTLYITYMTYPQ